MADTDVSDLPTVSGEMLCAPDSGWLDFDMAVGMIVVPRSGACPRPLLCYRQVTKGSLIFHTVLD